MFSVPHRVNTGLKFVRILFSVLSQNFSAFRACLPIIHPRFSDNCIVVNPCNKIMCFKTISYTASHDGYSMNGTTVLFRNVHGCKVVIYLYKTPSYSLLQFKRVAKLFRGAFCIKDESITLDSPDNAVFVYARNDYSLWVIKVWLPACQSLQDLHGSWEKSPDQCHSLRLANSPFHTSFIVWILTSPGLWMVLL